MAEAPPKPLHKPSESHTLDEVLKSLQDLIRNELVEPQAGSQPNIAKRSVAPPKITPTVKPASRWEARGLGKARPKPAEEVDVDAVLDSLRDIVTSELTVHTPRRAPPPAAPATPAGEEEIAEPKGEALDIEWTENLDAAAAALALEPESQPAAPMAPTPPAVANVQPPGELPPTANDGPSPETTPAAVKAIEREACESSGGPAAAEQLTPPAPEPAAAPTPSSVSPASGEQQSFLFAGHETVGEESLPTLEVAADAVLGLGSLPDTIELDELTHAHPPPAPPAATTADDRLAAPAEPPVAAGHTPPPRAIDDFEAVTPANVGTMPSVDFVPSGVTVKGGDASSARPAAGAAPPADIPPPVTPPSTGETGPPPAAAPQAGTVIEAPAASADIVREPKAPAATKPQTGAEPSPAPSQSPREIAVRTVAKLNIELRRCGERTLDPRMVDRLQFVLQELLKQAPAKKSS